MANIGDACNIIPQATTNSGREIDSPLYLDLAEVVKGDRDRAVSLYEKATSEEVLDRIKSLPKNLVSYYPDTNTPTLATVLNVSNMEGDIQEKELLDWLNDKVDYKVQFMKDLQHIVDFNSGEWNTRFKATYDTDGNVFIVPCPDTPDIGTKYDAFAAKVYSGILPIVQSLNISEDELNEMANDRDSIYPRVMFYRPEEFADLLLNISYLANNKQTKLVCLKKPNVVMAKFLISYMKNSDLYIRLKNDLRKDDYYKSYNTDPEFLKLSDEEQLQTVATYVIAAALSKETKNVKDSSSKLSVRLVEQFKDRIKHNSRMLPNKIKDIIKTANEETSIVDEKFVSAHPLFIGENLTGSEISKMQEVFNELQKLTVKYLSLSKQSYLENAANTEELSEEQSKWYDNIRHFGTAITQTDKELLNNHVRQTIQEIGDTARKVEEIVKKLSLDMNTKTSLLSNNLLCGKLRQATQTFDYLERMLKELDRINAFQRENNINSKIFTSEIETLIQKTNSIINSQKKVILDTTKNAVINELESTFPHRTFTLPSGESVGIREWIESNSAAFDVLASEKLLSSVEECSNPLLTLLDSYKKRAVEAGREEYQRLRDEIRDAARGLKSKDTSWMYLTTTNSKGTICPTGKYIVDYNFNKFAHDYKQLIDQVKKRDDISIETKKKILEDKFNELTEVRDDLDGGRYPKRDLYPNEAFNKLTDDQKHYWSVFMKNKGILINYFPERNYGIDDAILIRKSNRDILIENVKKDKLKGGFKALKKILMGEWDYTSRDIDVERPEMVTTDFDNELVYQLPIFYTSLNENETMEDISLDTTTSLEEYAKVMNNAASLRNVVNILNCAADVISNSKYKSRSVFEKPKKIFHRVGKYKDTEEYTVPPSELQSLKMYKDWLKMQVYGQRTHKVRRGWRLAANAYMKWVSFGTLAINTTSAVANIVQGLNQLVPAAIGGYFFSMKDLAKASWLYDKYMFPVRKDSGILELGGTVQNNKFNLFSRKFNIMQDYNDSVTKFDETRVERLINGNLLYFFLHAGEHYLQHRGALAMMENEKNKVITKNGEAITAFDAYETVKLNNGGSKLVLKEGLTTTVNGNAARIITNEELAERAKEEHKNVLDKSLLKDGEISESEWVSILSQKMSALNHYLHGVYNTEDQNKAQYYMLGRMAIMYRKYLVPALNRRFGANTYIAALDSDVEGYYNTLLKFNIRLTKELIGNYHKNYANLSGDMKSIADDYLEAEGHYTLEDKTSTWNKLDRKTRRNILFGKTNAWAATFGDLTAMQKGNMKTAWGEISIFFSLVIANLLLDFDDDDDDDTAMAALKYFMRRAQTEVGALTPVSMLLMPFAFADKQDHKELHALSRGTMFNESWQLFQQPIVGMNHIQDVPEIIGIFNIENWEEGSAKYNKDKYNREAWRLFAKQMTPFRQWKSWTADSFHRKEAWYKQ